MSPEQLQQFEEMKRTIEHLRTVTDVSFIAELKRRLNVVAPQDIRLSDLFDVDTGGVTDQQVIKYNITTQIWENANDIDT